MIFTGPFLTVTGIPSDVISLSSATPSLFEKSKLSTISGATADTTSAVVTEKVDSFGPMKSFASTAVLLVAEEVILTITLSLLFTVPAALVQPHPLIRYSPFAIAIEAGAVIPLTTISFEVIGLERAAQVTAVKGKSTGASVVAVGAEAIVFTSNLCTSPPIFIVATD